MPEGEGEEIKCSKKGGGGEKTIRNIHYIEEDKEGVLF